MTKYIVSAIIGFLLGVIFVTSAFDINTYCWKYTNIDTSDQTIASLDVETGELELYVTIKDPHGGMVEKAFFVYLPIEKCKE